LVDVVAGKEVAYDLTSTGELAPTMTGPPRIGEGKVKLGKGPGEGGGAASLVPGLARPDRAANVGSSIP
jgi:hypothetical protein